MLNIFSSFSHLCTLLFLHFPIYWYISHFIHLLFKSSHFYIFPFTFCISPFPNILVDIKCIQIHRKIHIENIFRISHRVTEISQKKDYSTSRKSGSSGDSGLGGALTSWSCMSAAIPVDKLDWPAPETPTRVTNKPNH